ncbi:hypothetical protein QC761_402130 [Podospora bellae-mahoneyi]|uniref:Uncharacterized protein n=1 Tax=Podospora bellae-mahoneyi TaxID=2093777 RepID=A0ABR0FI31_9PEZI|nr:hypothetical protein QC761_402130 [Podospora bellae-mahoneyi]
MSHKPGIIVVHSRPLSPLLPPIVFQTWYENIHIPDVLATGHVSSAARYRLTSPEANNSMPFLAVYHLPDMNWLRQDNCQFWKIPLHSKILPGDNSSILDVAEFKTEFYETVDTVQFGEPADGGNVPSKLLLSFFPQSKQGADSRSLHQSALANLGIGGSETIQQSMKSTLFKEDQSRPHHPAVPAPRETPGEMEYLCTLEYAGEIRLGPGVESNIRPEYTLLKAFE